MEIPKQQKESAMDCLATKMKIESVCWVVFYYLKIFQDIKKKKIKGEGRTSFSIDCLDLEKIWSGLL